MRRDPIPIYYTIIGVLYLCFPLLSTTNHIEFNPHVASSDWEEMPLITMGNGLGTCSILENKKKK